MIVSTDRDIVAIHEATLRILKETGMRFRHPVALRTLIENGIRVEGETAFFEAEQLERWVSKAPSRFTIYARDPKYNLEVGGDQVNFLLGTGAALVCNEKGEQHLATTQDFVECVKLYEQCAHYHTNGGGVVQAQDVDPRHRMTTALFTSLLYTNKVLEAESIEDGASGMADAEEMLSLLEIAFSCSREDLIAKPRCIAITNTNSPLLFDQKMLDMLIAFAINGQPIVIAACAMAGTTGPVTLAGNIALTNAEVLAGIALSQMIRPGCPVVYGSQSTGADMRSGSIANGSPEAALTYAYGAKLAKAYRLPCRGGGALSDAKSLSVQAGYESMMTLLASANAGINLIFHSSGMMNSYACISPEKLIVDFEIVGMVKRYLRGVSVNEDTLAVDAIAAAGIGGEFISSDHTLEHMRDEMFYPDIALRGSLSGDFDALLLERIRQKKASMLASYVRPVWDSETLTRMIQFMETLGIERDRIARIVTDDFPAPSYKEAL